MYKYVYVCSSILLSKPKLHCMHRNNQQKKITTRTLYKNECFFIRNKLCLNIYFLSSASCVYFRYRYICMYFIESEDSYCACMNIFCMF